MLKLKTETFYQFFDNNDILISSHKIEGDDVIMRKEITKELLVKEGGVNLNKSELARRLNCCWETIDRRLNPEKYKKEKVKREYHSKLDPYKTIIDEKIENENIPAMAIYYFLKERYDYDGKYGIVRKYVTSKKKDIVKNLTIRFETLKGYQSQVDWKEKIKLHDKYGNEYVVSIFLMVLGHSRFKFIKLTTDQTQETLFTCLTEAFKYFGGTTEEILFDNMKTIVDHTKSSYTEVVLNTKAVQFSKDASFEIITCRPYRPQTKGKVETLAKIMNRLYVFDYEFEDWNELDKIVKDLNYNLNYSEKSQAIDQIPIVLFEKEKEYLKPVPYELLETYYKHTKTYKVSNESMIKYNGIKYSVPIQYVNKQLTVSEDDKFIYLYYNSNLINSYPKNTNCKYNYKETDYIDILKHSSFNNKTEKELNEYINKNLNSLDRIYIDKGENKK